MPKLTNKIQPAGLLIQHDRGLLRTVYSSRAIRERYTEQSGCGGRSSLMIVARPDEHVRFNVRETETDLLFSTDDLTVGINRRTLAFTYRDAAGSMLTREPAHGGKTIEPVDVDVSGFDGDSLHEDSESVEIRSRLGIY